LKTGNRTTSFPALLGVVLSLLWMQFCISPLFCQTSQVLPDTVIFQKWLHSYEEDTGDLKIYRPSTFDFPLGWGRDGMTFTKDGGFLLRDIAPNDTMMQINGHWKATSEIKLEISFPSGEKETFILEIKDINSKILKIMKL
jgi:hypothetical protein